MNFRKPAPITVISLLIIAWLALLLTWSAAHAEPDHRVRIANTNPPMYAPTHTELYHQIVGIHATWVFWMTDRLRLAGNAPMDIVATGTTLRNTYECAAGVNFETLATSLLMSEAPFTDEWLALTVVERLLAACNDHYANKEDEQQLREDAPLPASEG